MDTERIDDRPLLEQFRQGDRNALATLYRSHYPAIYRFALYMTDDPDAAAEVVQETFLWLIHHPGAFDPERGSLRSFLSGVARKLLQRRTRDQRRLQSLSTLPYPGPVTAESTDAAIDAGIQARNLRAAIVELPEAYREAIILCGIENKSYEEAAAILDCAVGTVRSRVHRAKQHLAGTLARILTPVGTPTHE